MVEVHTKTVVKACHHWVKTCFWLNVDPEQVLFPMDDADAVLEKAKSHKQFVKDTSDDKAACKPRLFTQANEWDEWAKTFEVCPSLLPGCTGIPSFHVI